MMKWEERQAELLEMHHTLYPHVFAWGEDEPAAMCLLCGCPRNQADRFGCPDRRDRAALEQEHTQQADQACREGGIG